MHPSLPRSRNLFEQKRNPPRRPWLGIVFSLAAPLVALCACNDGLHGEDVHGRVVDGFGLPVSRARVAIGERAFTTNERGEFTFERVTLPYDLAVLPEGTTSVHWYVKLSSTEPRLKVYEARNENSFSASITLKGAVRTSPTIGRTQVVELRGASDTMVGSGDIPPSDPWISLAWIGRPDVTLHAYVFQYEKDPLTEEPIRYLAYDEIERSVNNRDAFDWTVQWKPFPFEETSIEVKGELPEGYRVSEARLDLMLQGTNGNAGFLTSKAPDTASFVVPVIPGLRVDAAVAAVSSSNTCGTVTRTRDVDLQQGLVTITLEPGPEAQSPGPDANGIDVGSSLSWNGAQHTALVTVSAGLNLPSLLVYTDEPSFELPSLSPLGLAWPAHTKYQWSVMTGNADSVDELAQEGWPTPEQLAFSTPRDFITR